MELNINFVGVMRKCVYMTIAVLMLVMVLAGCGGSVDERLVRVCGLADANDVDSAKVVLNGVCRDELDEHNRYYYDLMSIKTRDKGYEDITGDTIITDIVAYFEGKGNDAELGEAYYYGGRVCREQGDAPQALDYFQKAIDALQNGAHVQRKGKIASQMGQIFLELYLFDQAKDKFQEAIAYQTACGDSVGMILDNRGLGEIYKKLNQSDSALLCFRKSLDLIKEYSPHSKMEVDILSSVINLYISQGKYEKARNDFEVFDTLSKHVNKDYVLSTKINMYIINQDYIKAIEMAQKMAQSESLTSKMFAYSILLDYSKETNNLDSVYYYATEKEKCTVILNEQASANAVIHQNSFYNYTLREKKNYILEKKNLKTQIVSLFSILLLMAIIISISYIYKKVKRRNYILSKRNQLLQTSKELLCVELSERLDRIKKLENDIQIFKDRIVEEYSEVSQVGEKVRTNILERLQNISIVDIFISENILLSDVYNKLKQIAKEKNGNVNEIYWKKLDVLINSEYPNFKNRIQILYPNITDLEYKLCLLVKCHFSINDCAFLINRERSSVPKMRKKIYEKLFHVTGEPSDFDRFISLL